MSQLVSITPSDTNPLAQAVQALWVGVTGDIALWSTQDGVAGAVTFKAVPAGWFAMPQNCFIAGVKATSTTATNLVAVMGCTPSAKP